jgi:hypothetical protein
MVVGILIELIDVVTERVYEVEVGTFWTVPVLSVVREILICGRSKCVQGRFVEHRLLKGGFWNTDCWRAVCGTRISYSRIQGSDHQIRGLSEKYRSNFFPRKCFIRTKWKYRERNVCSWAISPHSHHVFWDTCPSVWQHYICHCRRSPCLTPLTKGGPRCELLRLTRHAVPQVASGGHM